MSCVSKISGFATETCVAVGAGAHVGMRKGVSIGFGIGSVFATIASLPTTFMCYKPYSYAIKNDLGDLNWVRYQPNLLSCPLEIFETFNRNFLSIVPLTLVVGGISGIVLGGIGGGLNHIFKQL